MPCPSGSYQDAEGTTSCKVCECGAYYEYCVEGAAAALPWKEGSYSTRFARGSCPGKLRQSPLVEMQISKLLINLSSDNLSSDLCQSARHTSPT